MKKTVEYSTRQRRVIEQYIASMGDGHFTVDSLCATLLQNGEAVGRTTVYRCVEKLKNEGKLRKYAQNAGESACYQFVGDGQCHDHFHLKCENCGDLIHMDCRNMTKLAEHIKSHHGFDIDPLKTVFYGVCERCRSK